MAAKKRVHELAKELGLTNKETLDLCGSLGIGVKTHSSSIEDAQADRVRRKAEREGLVRDVQPDEPAKPAKVTKKAAASSLRLARGPGRRRPAPPAPRPPPVAEPAPVEAPASRPSRPRPRPGRRPAS